MLARIPFGLTTGPIEGAEILVAGCRKETVASEMRSNVLKYRDTLVITFSLFPERKRNASICVTTWFRNNSRGMRVINDLEWETLPEKDIIDDIIFKALGMALVYVSPAWWYSLTPEQQDDIF